MENKDLGSAATATISEATPLVQDEKIVETSVTESSLNTLTSDLSDANLEIDDKVTSTIPLDVITVEPEGAAIQVSSNSEGEDQSEASTDVEQSETEVAGETSEPLEDPQEISPRSSESPRSSSSDPEIRRGNRLWDKIMWKIFLEIILLGYPISATYYAMKYVGHCDSGDELPLLVILVAFSTFLVLLARMLVNAARKLSLYDENNLLPWTVILAGDLLTAVLFIIEIAYYSTMDTGNCEKLYGYVNFANKTGMPIVVIGILCNVDMYIRCFNNLRQ